MGVGNFDYIIETGKKCDNDVIFAWGAFDLGKPFWIDMILRRFPEGKCLGITKDGEPKHPLYLPKNTIPMHYNGFNKPTKAI